MNRRIILIGGAPVMGKSSLAKKLSDRMKIPWISTDTIRKFMRKVVREDDYPDLFYFKKKEPESYLTSHTPEQIVKDQNKESIEVWKGVRSFIDSVSIWDSYIIEGVAILPKLIFKDFSDKNYIKPIFLLTNDEKRIKKIIFKRGLWSSAKNYPDRLKIKEVEWVLCFNYWLRNELKKYKYPILEFKGDDTLISKIKRYL